MNLTIEEASSMALRASIVLDGAGDSISIVELVEAMLITSLATEYGV